MAAACWGMYTPCIFYRWCPAMHPMYCRGLLQARPTCRCVRRGCRPILTSSCNHVANAPLPMDHHQELACTARYERPPKPGLYIRKHTCCCVLRAPLCPGIACHPLPRRRRSCPCAQLTAERQGPAEPGREPYPSVSRIEDVNNLCVFNCVARQSFSRLQVAARAAAA